MATRRLTSQEEIAVKRFEIGQLFTPSSPVSVAELFAGRSAQMLRIIDSIAEVGRHVILYGERGVGKTSLAKIVPFLIPGPKGRVRYCRVQAFPNDNFQSIARKIFSHFRFSENGEGV